MIERKVHLYVLLVEMQTSAVIMENSIEIPQNTKIDLTQDSAIPLLGIYSNEMK